ncbi:hypothetical protein BDN72DRAFT_851852 [Pluteus cervinus]|uniref:Uncharacterized protein n=1 Tax=Pluteus cervinus TaxID=181527 RepID=A0ACD2ZX50_9AGAR|nr:hypothetical protein BDN72DRAFT_851852 [Pluteus cervinus]
MQLISLYDKFSPAIRDVRNNPCPVSTIPIELLQEIFAFSMTLKPAPRIRTGISFDELEPPGFQATALILTWVCSQWRQIALSMQELWCTMNIYKPKKYCVELAKVYLGRSGDSAPLNLYLRQDFCLDPFPNADACPEHNATVDILKLWVPQAHRWKSIFLFMSATPPSYELPKIPLGALSSLQEADVRFVKMPRSSDIVIEWLWGNIFQSPALRTAFCHNLLSKLPVAPFSQLTEFGPFLMAADEFLSLLSSCYRLRRLSGTISTKQISHRTLEAPIISPYLEYLNLHIGQNSPAILDQFSTPVLRELKLADRRDAALSEADSLAQLLERSQCTLRSLHLRQIRVETQMPIIEYFGRALHRLSSLEVCSLTLSNATFSERVISIFTPRLVNDTLLVPFPCLVDLELSPLVTPDGTISSMVESRSAAGAPLWAFECEVKHGPSNPTGHSKDQAVLQRLMRDGLQLDWELLNG